MSAVEVGRILEVSGVRHLDHDSTYGEILRAIITARRLVRFAYPHDVALVYADLVRTFETMRMDLPWSTEDIFFDDIYAEIAHVQHNVEGVREEDRALDQGRVGDTDGEEHSGEPERERGGHPRRVEIMVPRPGERDGPGGGAAGGAGEVPQGPKPMEESGRSRRGDDLPF